MDAARRLSLTAGVTVIAVAASAPVATAVLARADPSAHPLPVAVAVVAVVLAAVTLLGGVWYLARTWLQLRVPALVDHAMALDLVALLALQALITVQVTSTGGVRHPLWLSYALVIVLASSYLPLGFAPAFGVLSCGCLLAAAQLSGTLTAASAGDLVVACLGLGFLSALGTAGCAWVRTVRGDADLARAELAGQVEELSRALAGVAGGDLREGAVTPSEQVPGPVGRVWASLGTAVESVREVVVQVQDGGQQLAAAAAQLSAASTRTADGSSVQAAAVQETTASVHRLSDAAAGIAQTADDVAEAADEVTRVSAEGRAVVNLAVDAIDELAAKVREIAGEAVGLQERTTEIDRILEVIDELADQTNLLALNAAIEAARAGEHGRGFAVVAAEVRKLAERAQASTGQIQAIVVGIRSGTHRTVLASEDGARAAVRGAELAEAVEERLDHIAAAASRSAHAAGLIQQATRQQDDASEAVLETMGLVAAASQEQADGARSSAQAVAELNRLAQDLRACVTALDTS
jgi:methyl-accepting chemotaxis protein